MGRFRARADATLRRRLAAPSVGTWLALLAFVLALPSLGTGLAADDFVHKSLLLGKSESTLGLVSTGRFDIFSFFDGNPERTLAIMRTGLTPWWTDTALVIRFFRPVAAATHLLDYRLWPASPPLMHLQSACWYAALVFAAAGAYRALLAGVQETEPGRPSALAGAAALLFAIDPSHGLPVGWVANRNAVVAATFALASLWAQARRRRSSPIVSALLFALALGAGEGAVAGGAFLAAYVVFLDDRPWRGRLVSVVPHVVVFVVWVVIYRLGRYGVTGSGVYVEPLRSPAAFAFAVITHGPVLFASELSAVFPSDLFAFVPTAAKAVYVAVALAILGWASVPVRSLVRRDRHARFFLAAAIAGVLPACATFPSSRLLVLPGFAIVGLLAMVVRDVWSGSGSTVSASFVKVALFGHVVLAPIMFETNLAQMFFFQKIVTRLASGASMPRPSPDGRLVIVNAPDPHFVGYVLLAVKDADPARAPRSMLTFAGGARDVTVTRSADRALTVRTPGGFYRVGMETLARRGDTTIPAGTKIPYGWVEIEVTHVLPDGVPDEAVFRFASPLADEAALVFRVWKGGVLVPFEVPSPGESVTLRGQFLDLK